MLTLSFSPSVLGRVGGRMAMVAFAVVFLSIPIAKAKQPFTQPCEQVLPNLFQWTDTCNVYVLRDRNSALLFDLGAGDVLDPLDRIDVSSVEWLLLTDHHREQYQGVDQLNRTSTRVAAPALERELFEQPTSFRKWWPKLGDTYTVHGASFVRPGRRAVSLDKTFDDGEVFQWHGYEIECLSTPGHSPGGMSYLIRRQGSTVAVTGGLMHAGAKMTTWFDTEWDYGFAKGIDALLASVHKLRAAEIDALLPSHGPVVRNPKEQLAEYAQKLTTFRQSYVRGYPVFDSQPKDRDSISRPTAVPLINRVTPHLYKLSHKTQGKNFAIIVADSGKGLVLDCGLFPEKMLDEIVLGMRQHLGLKSIDAFWISHMHGDHFLLGPSLKRKYGAQAWTLDRIVDKCEHPRRYDYAALVASYGNGFDGMKIDKAFRDGETVEWEGLKIQVDWMPGQTEFGCCLWLELDDKRIAFTGDNLFGNPEDATQNGHEAMVARNSAILEEGYIQGSRYLKNLNPDIVMGSHSYVMHKPAEFLDRYHRWSKQMLKLYQEILPYEDYEYLFDPYWVSAYPYRVDLRKPTGQSVKITVRNFRKQPQQHRIVLKLPAGVAANPPILVGTIPPESRRTFPVILSANPNTVDPGVHIVTLDITLDGKRYGELFDFVVRAGATPKTGPH